MGKHSIATMFLMALLLAISIAPSGLAHQPERGTTLVCVPGDGASTALVEFSPEQIADYETGYGHEPARAHPTTGICMDPAGLPIGESDNGWRPGWSWICLTESDGRMAGPVWLLRMNPNAVFTPPDPATGACPEPRSTTFGIWALANPAAATAVHMTELEVAGEHDRLYEWMHPDSQAIVPREAMEGWYREEFAARPPVWMRVDEVRLVEWTWEVTGKVYPSAAEVRYRQRFADGEETAGVMRLVRDGGAWRWFFGRDRAFVEEQIERYAGS
jgi:hypothetical protein